MQGRSGKLALITGASAGIGKELARIHASNGGDLILVARRLNKLQELRKELESEYQVKVHCLASDLSQKEAPDKIFQEVKKAGLNVDYLINNAGFSIQGNFDEIDWRTIEEMIMVDVQATVKLCHLFLPVMKKRGHGKIMNVASSAAFAPGGPLQTIYYASKSFVVSFSQGLAGELDGTDITVTALCPGATNTEFEKVSGLDKTDLFSIEKAYSAEHVARDGYEALLSGDLVKLTALTGFNKFVLKNMNLFPSKRVLQQIKARQEIKK